MEFSEILSFALASLIVLVIAHFAVYWVVRTLYPPTPPVAIPVMTAPVPAVSFTEPPVTEQQHVIVPTYEAPVSAQTPSQESTRRGLPPPESTSIHGNPGDTISNPQ